MTYTMKFSELSWHLHLDAWRYCLHWRNDPAYQHIHEYKISGRGVTHDILFDAVREVEEWIHTNLSSAPTYEQPSGIITFVSEQDMIAVKLAYPECFESIEPSQAKNLK